MSPQNVLKTTHLGTWRHIYNKKFTKNLFCPSVGRPTLGTNTIHGNAKLEFAAGIALILAPLVHGLSSDGDVDHGARQFTQTSWPLIGYQYD